MMTRNISRYARLRILAAIPVVALLMTAFAFTARATETQQQPAPSTEKKMEAAALGDVMPQPEVMPTFEGGTLTDFSRWLMTRIKYPAVALENGITGQVSVRFVVETDGSVGNIEIIKSPHEILSDEVIRVLKTSPRWNAGMHEGKPVRTSFILPINFGLSK